MGHWYDLKLLTEMHIVRAVLGVLSQLEFTSGGGSKRSVVETEPEGSGDKIRRNGEMYY